MVWLGRVVGVVARVLASFHEIGAQPLALAFPIYSAPSAVRTAGATHCGGKPVIFNSAPDRNSRPLPNHIPATRRYAAHCSASARHNVDHLRWREPREKNIARIKSSGKHRYGRDSSTTVAHAMRWRKYGTMPLTRSR